MDECRPSASKVITFFRKINAARPVKDHEQATSVRCVNAENATLTNETAEKTLRDFGTKALRRGGVQESTPGGGTALTLLLRVRDAAIARLEMLRRTERIIQTKSPRCIENFALPQ
jgi:hypothetical protein